MIQEILSGHDHMHKENIIQQTFTDILNRCCDLDLKCSNPIFPQDTPDYDAVLSNNVRLQINQQLEDTTEIIF